MLRQTNVDSTTTCASLSDKECLASLDAEFDGLTDKYRLAYLVESCNELQHYSAFAATPVAESGGALPPAPEPGRRLRARRRRRDRDLGGRRLLRKPVCA